MKLLKMPTISDLLKSTYDPYLMKDMDKAVSRIEQTVTIKNAYMDFGD
jgi:hypothetical protein